MLLKRFLNRWTCSKFSWIQTLASLCTQIHDDLRCHCYEMEWATCEQSRTCCLSSMGSPDCRSLNPSIVLLISLRHWIIFGSLPCICIHSWASKNHHLLHYSQNRLRIHLPSPYYYHGPIPWTICYFLELSVYQQLLVPAIWLGVFGSQDQNLHHYHRYCGYQRCPLLHLIICAS